MDLLEKEFGNKAIIRGGIYLYNTSDALEVIARCKELGLRILGIDSFKITSTTTQPILEHSVEFMEKEGSWADATDFVTKRIDKGFVYEVVYE